MVVRFGSESYFGDTLKNHRRARTIPLSHKIAIRSFVMVGVPEPVGQFSPSLQGNFQIPFRTFATSRRQIPLLGSLHRARQGAEVPPCSRRFAPGGYI
jgi:hypothetical protein